MKTVLARHAWWLGPGLLCVLAGGLLLAPPIAQPQDYHRLADARALALGPWTLPNAADVLSSLAFVVVGVAGLGLLRRAPAPQQLPLGVFFAGLALIGPGSIHYHLAPTDTTLFWDRLAMSIAFAGAVGAVAAERLGPVAGRAWLCAWLLLGMLALTQWRLADDLRLYLVVQFGGFALLSVWLALPCLPGCLRLPWGWLLLAYALAKLFEMADQAVWTLSGGLLAGHALKHLVAALGVLPLLHALARPHNSGGR
ncbi:MAG TPA: hypothetical protein PLF79_15235 [Thauera sp.]|uniref:hypothetical protein n=1 Tax=Thauera sp. TaxID=1905334 RepID=UPI002CC2A868|nr:hypothetical protein [Thauera sp.]HRP25790.1 hypothetical protein [Thauera sp.]HRP67429.1 hypothetical protein [Thauera sp.]